VEARINEHAPEAYRGLDRYEARKRVVADPFYDVAPSGEAVEINGTAVLRLRDGKIVEHWGGPHCQDGLGLTH
jgi:hypothetical protein